MTLRRKLRFDPEACGRIATSLRASEESENKAGPSGLTRLSDCYHDCDYMSIIIITVIVNTVIIMV